MDSAKDRPDLIADKRLTAKRWPWFAAGFFAAFIAMLLTLTNYTPSGDGILGCKLWRYYVLMIPEVFRTAPLGSGNGSLSHLTETLVIHVIGSSLGGVVFLGVGWSLGKRREEYHSPASKS